MGSSDICIDFEIPLKYQELNQEKDSGPID